MAAEKKTATPTEYLVLVHVSIIPEAGTDNRTGWKELKRVSAHSSEAAIRLSADPKRESDIYVAVPARSWKPVTVNPQTTIRLELTEAKP